MPLPGWRHSAVRRHPPRSLAHPLPAGTPGESMQRGSNIRPHAQTTFSHDRETAHSMIRV